MADCDRCAALAHRVHAVDEAVQPALATWTAASHADVVLRSIAREGLKKADVPPELRERVGRWRERLVRGALHLIRQASGQFSDAVEEAVNVLLPPPGWEMSARPAVWAAEPVTTFKGEGEDFVVVLEPSLDIP